MKNPQGNQDQSILTKNQLLSWLNSTLQIKVHSIEELANGAAFCQLLDVMSPGSVRMNKINWNAKLQHENLSNIKILETSMMALGIEKKFDTIRVSQKKHMEILQLLQWFRKYFQTNHIPKIKDYDPIARRKSISAQKQLQNRFVDENKRFKITLPTSIPKPYHCQKVEYKDLSPQNQVKHCFKTIKRIVTEQNRQSEENKLQKIKNLLFKTNPQILTRESENPQLSQGKTIKDYPNLSEFEAPIKFEFQQQQNGTPYHQMSEINAISFHEDIESNLNKIQMDLEFGSEKTVKSDKNTH